MRKREMGIDGWRWREKCVEGEGGVGGERWWGGAENMYVYKCFNGIFVLFSYLCKIRLFIYY